MTTQSKSVLMPFLIIAGIVFAVALAWKFLGYGTDTAVKPAEVEMVEPVKEKQITPATITPTIVNYDEPAPFLEATPEDKVALRKQATHNMKFSMRYPTLESALTALKQFENDNNDEMADSLITYIETVFPNDTIPSDLLD